MSRVNCLGPDEAHCLIEHFTKGAPMPTIYRACPDIEHSFTRPVLLEVVRDILARTGLPADTRLFLPSDLDNDIQTGQALGTNPNNVKFSGTDKFTITAVEEIDPGKILSTAVIRQEQYPIAIDRELGLLLKPIFGESRFRLDIRFRSTDAARVKYWADMFRVKAAQMRDLYHHNPHYSYYVTNDILERFAHIHDLSERVAPYGRSFKEFMNHVFSKRASHLVNSSGNQAVLAISEQSIGAQGWFNFSRIPDADERYEDGAARVVGFSYVVAVDKPLGLVFQYPLMVHNQLVAPEYYPAKTDAQVINTSKVGRSASLSALEMFETKRLDSVYHSNAGLSIPAIDEFLPDNVLPDTVRIYTALTSISASDRRTLMKLDDTGEFILSDQLKEFMRAEKNWLGVDYGSLIGASVYRGQQIQEFSNFEVADDLTISAKYDLDLRQIHRVRLGILTKWHALSESGQKRARALGELTNYLLKTIYPHMADLTIVNGEITKADWRDLIWQMAQSNKPFGGWMRVQNFFINASRM